MSKGHSTCLQSLNQPHNCILGLHYLTPPSACIMLAAIVTCQHDRTTLPPQVPCGDSSSLETYSSTTQWVTAFVCNATLWQDLLEGYMPRVTVVPTKALCCPLGPPAGPPPRSPPPRPPVPPSPVWSRYNLRTLPPFPPYPPAGLSQGL